MTDKELGLERLQVAVATKQVYKLCQEPITRSLHLPYKPYETTFARIFLLLETAGS